MTSDPSSNVPSTPPPAAPGDITQDDKTMAMLAHLLGILTWFVGPLIIWLLKKDRPFVEGQAKEALNWQITLTIAYIISSILMTVCIGFFTYLAVVVCALIFGIKGLMQANQGIAYRYPFALRLIK